MGIQDSHKFDESPDSLAVVQEFEKKYPKPDEAKAHAYSQTYWEFMNKLGSWMQTNTPGKLLLGDAYSDVRIRPDFKLSPNILAVTVWGIAELEADGRLKPAENGVSELDGWLKVANHFGNHDWLMGNGYLIPRSYTGYYATYLKALKTAGVQDSFQHLEAYPNWGLDGPKYYIVSRLMWNPDQDVNTLWKQFSEDMFGPAAAPMQEYFQTLENLWVQLDNVEGPERKLFRWSTQFNTTDKSMAMVKAARAALDKASTLAATPEQKERIELFSKTFRMSEMFFELASPTTVPDAQVEAHTAKLKQYLQEQIVPDPMTLYSRARDMKVLEDAIKQVTAGRKAKR
jgi:hypothetical protein